MVEFDSENDRKLQLECLRLASDLTQLAKDSPDPEVRANALRMAKEWTDKAERGPPYDDTTREFLT
jgi:hypothetical protein